MVAGPASAGVTEQITNYRSEVTIEHDGTIEVHETIAYDFGVVPHHGIYRDVPVRTDQSGKDGYDRVYPLDVVSVAASEGTPAQYTVEDQGDDQRIKIGDPDATITGQHVYDITYRVQRRDERVRRPRRAGLERGRPRVVRTHRAGERGRPGTRGHPAGAVHDRALRLVLTVRRRRRRPAPRRRSGRRSWRRTTR